MTNSLNDHYWITMPGRIFLVTILVSIICLSSFSQTVDYRKLFGDNWEKAEKFEKENKSWMDSILSMNHIDYPIAIAVIFPELVRYSALRDRMETSLLKTLYVNLGEEYANFSIGRFQMKPSFAEFIRSKSVSLYHSRSSVSFNGPKYYDDIKDFRKSIVADLENTKTEFNYLVAFIRICENSFNIQHMDEMARLKFLATAYNFGPDKSEAEIDSMVDKKFFNIKLFATENYSYADVSLYWYMKHQ